MFQAFLIKYGEIGVKGKNRYVFENALVDRMKVYLRRLTVHFILSENRVVSMWRQKEALTMMRPLKR